MPGAPDEPGGVRDRPGVRRQPAQGGDDLRVGAPEVAWEEQGAEVRDLKSDGDRGRDRDDPPGGAEARDQEGHRRHERAEVVPEHRVLEREHDQRRAGPPPEEPRADRRQCTGRRGGRTGSRDPEPAAERGDRGEGAEHRQDREDREHRVPAPERRHDLGQVREQVVVRRLVEVVADVVVEHVLEPPRQCECGHDRDRPDRDQREVEPAARGADEEHHREEGRTHQQALGRDRAAGEEGDDQHTGEVRSAAVGDRHRHGARRERGGRTVAGDRAGGPEEHAAAGGEAGRQQRPAAVGDLHPDRVHGERHDDARQHRQQARRVAVAQAGEVGQVHEWQEERALGREDLTEGRGTLAHRDRGQAVPAVVVAQLGRREHRREADQERAQGQQRHVRPPAKRRSARRARWAGHDAPSPAGGGSHGTVELP